MTNGVKVLLMYELLKRKYCNYCEDKCEDCAVSKVREYIEQLEKEHK